MRRGSWKSSSFPRIIQSGVPPEFLRDEQEAVWQAQIEAGSQILNHLDRALELHRMTDYQISQVSGCLPRIVRICPSFRVFYPRLSTCSGCGTSHAKRVPR